ncbi:MAG: AmmeMemoRadiSam system protein B [Planctomycetes bacterium]|nr:AmmeMemoRadiSam system protein B [Planctomycetota bacterium]
MNPTNAAHLGSAVRRAALAGKFYPGEPGPMYHEVKRYLAAGGAVQPKAYRAVMLPHAGWKYCGETLGKTLARVAVPDTVIIIGPKHTPYGANWSVAPHEQWEIPGGVVPIGTDVVHRLTGLVPDLRCEPDAHVVEHGSEVLLPFIHRINPHARVVPIVMGETYFEATHYLADALATVIAESPTPILLVISSDMNHFAAEPENRRLDQMAIEAMCSGDPARLHRTCEQNRISMCGVIPAVTVMQSLQAATPVLRPELVDYSNSAAASGDASRVVGYAGVVIA